MKYALIYLVVFVVLGCLKYFEGSPIRSWKSACFISIPLGLMVCWYASVAFPPPPPPLPRADKVAANRAELERTFRRISGVNGASITGQIIRLDFAQDKTSAEFKSIAQQTCGTAATFLKINETNRMTVFITVNGRDRCALTYDARTGVMDETGF